MTQVLDSVKRMLAKQQWLAAQSLLYNYLNQNDAHKTAENLEREFQQYVEYDRGQAYYKPTVQQLLERYVDDIELSTSLGFKVTAAAVEHQPATTSSAFEAFEIWLLQPKSSLGNLLTDLTRHCTDVAQTLEALGLIEASDEFFMIARKANRPGADQNALIEKAKEAFNKEVLPLIKELREPIGIEQLRNAALSQSATLQDIETLIEALPKGVLKAALKTIHKSPKSDVVKIILAKQAIQNNPA